MGIEYIYIYIIFIYYFVWHCSPARAMVSSFTRFRDHTNDPPQSVGLLWTSVQFVAETSTCQHTTHTKQKNIHAPGGIRSHVRSRRAAADLRLRPRGHWDRLDRLYIYIYIYVYNCTVKYNLLHS
jgi:hypothetical protein